MKALVRWIGCLVLAGIALELFFLLRIAAMAAVDPQSTTFQRSEMWRLALRDGGEAAWHQQWVPYERIGDHLKRAVIASEDAAFTDHEGVEWEAIERARQRNAKAEALAAQRAVRAAARGRPVR
ncbi:MAG: transglycosylase domain-containing protein, partial [Xenophilus sp.]